MKILFVCTGNTCRSSMAEALARKLLTGRSADKCDVQFFSAGVAAFPEDRASREAVQAMSEMGINLQHHRATRLSRDNVLESDLILTMTRGHFSHIKNLFPLSAAKVFTLAGYADSTGDVPDPFGQSLEGYRRCARRLEELIDRMLDKLLQKNK